MSRLAVCDCGKVTCSSMDLPFYKYKGSTKEVPAELLKEFWRLMEEGWGRGYSGRHDYKNPKSFPQDLDEKIEQVRREIYRASKYDSYYCGCKGWD
jgi:hypothetical protein